MCAGVLASGGEDGAIAVWNLAAAAEGQNVLSTVMRQEEEKGIRMPPQLLFQHFGPPPHGMQGFRVSDLGPRVLAVPALWPPPHGVQGSRA